MILKDWQLVHGFPFHFIFISILENLGPLELEKLDKFFIR